MPVRLELGPLNKFEQAIMDGLKTGAPNPVRSAFKRIAAFFRAWTKERFVRYSRGGGDWAPLKPSTIARRRKGKGRNLEKTTGDKTKTVTVAGGTVSILYDTGTLIAALDPTFSPSSGAVEKDIPFGIRVGMGGGAKHPKSSRFSIGDIAEIHQAGATNLPSRKIIVEPPMGEQETYSGEIQKALGRSWKDATA
jgi:hypothetical protein